MISLQLLKELGRISKLDLESHSLGESRWISSKYETDEKLIGDLTSLLNQKFIDFNCLSCPFFDDSVISNDPRQEWNFTLTETGVEKINSLKKWNQFKSFVDSIPIEKIFAWIELITFGCGLAYLFLK